MGFFSQSTGSTGLFKKKKTDGDHDDLTDICPIYALIYCRKKILLTWNHACNIPKEAIKMGVFLSNIHRTCFIMFIYIYKYIYMHNNKTNNRFNWVLRWFLRQLHHQCRSLICYVFTL